MNPLSAPDDISHQASAWFALINGGEPSQAEREQLAAWLAADPRHAQAYAELESLWAASATLLRPRAAVVRPQFSRRRLLGMGVAASAAAVAAGSATLWFKGIGSPLADLRTAVGERRTLQLPDGSSIELAGNTALNLDFSAGRRALQLLQGEVFCNVLGSADNELTIGSEAGRVATREGEFCLSCEGTTALLTVSRKTVRVITGHQQTDVEEGLSLAFGGGQTEAISHADLDQVLAWRSGRLVFFDKPLSSVVKELQRWREGKIFIPDPQLAARRVSLIINLNRPEQMLDVLAKALSVRTTQYTELVTLIYPA